MDNKFTHLMKYTETVAFKHGHMYFVSTIKPCSSLLGFYIAMHTLFHIEIDTYIWRKEISFNFHKENNGYFVIPFIKKDVTSC